MGKRRPVPTLEGHQQCHQCLAIKPYADFDPSRDRACGIKSRCRPCLRAFREEREGVRMIVEESAARIDAFQYAPTIVPDYKPLLSPIPESERKTGEYFRGIDAMRRRKRLQRRK